MDKLDCTVHIKTENWNGFPIRFVESDGQWWAVGADVSNALGYAKARNAIKRHCKGALKRGVLTNGGIQEQLIIPETDIYRMAFKSEKPEAEDFQDWICQVIKNLRKSIGLEGFQVFRMLDKERQKEAMAKLCGSLNQPVRVDFIKANTIANKAVSAKYGYPKMMKKADMTPEMLIERQGLLDSTVELMAVKEKFHLNLSVSDEIYKLASGQSDKAG